MPASDLFASSYDVEWRLHKTWIVVGKMPLFVASLEPHSNLRKTLLICRNIRGDHLAVELGRLPLSAMTNCPYGYFQGRWFARAPARHRWQGIKASSWWIVGPHGELWHNDDWSPETLLPEFLSQPRYAQPGRFDQGVLTRDVYIDPMTKDVMIRGLVRGKYLGDDRVLINPETPRYLRGFLDNALLSWEEDNSRPEVDEDEEELKVKDDF